MIKLSHYYLSKGTTSTLLLHMQEEELARIGSLVPRSLYCSEFSLLCTYYVLSRALKLRSVISAYPLFVSRVCSYTVHKVLGGQHSTSRLNGYKELVDSRFEWIVPHPHPSVVIALNIKPSSPKLSASELHFSLSDSSTHTSIGRRLQMLKP